MNLLFNEQRFRALKNLRCVDVRRNQKPEGFPPIHMYEPDGRFMVEPLLKDDGTPYKVAILIPTINNADELEIVLDRLAQQTYPDLEVVIADSKSRDHTKDVCEKYGGQKKSGSPDMGSNGVKRGSKWSFSTICRKVFICLFRFST